MSEDMRAFLVLGCKVTSDDLFVTTQERECSHPLPVNAAYCPTCGKPAYTTEKTARFDEDTGSYTGRIGAFDVLISTNGWDDYRTDALIGVITLTSDGDMVGLKTPLDDDTAIRTALRAELEPLDLWDESRFGLWLVLDDY